MSRSLQELGIDRMSIPERLELIGQIWDSITAADEELPIPDWHREEVDRRKAAADANPGGGRTWEEVQTRLSQK